MTAISNSSSRPALEPMVLFAHVWAVQALVHQEFVPHWLADGNIFGWILVVCAVATLLYPSSLLFLSAMLVFSVVYHFGEWPWVMNHLLLLVFIDLTLLSAIAVTVYSAWRRGSPVDSQVRAEVYTRFAPVLRATTIAVYYLIFISKLNWDFVNLDTSCLTDMYQQVVDRFAPLPIPTADWALDLALWAFLAVEIVLPVFLMFERTRYVALLIGLPFHLLLGLIGHRTFSAFIYALYFLFCMEPMLALLSDIRSRIRREVLDRAVKLARVIVPLLGAAAALVYLTGDYTEPRGVLAPFDYGPEIWFFWACAIGLLFTAAILREYRSREPRRPQPMPSVRPGWLWAFFGIAIVNGLSPYLGLKTQTSYTMYSNLRTEAGVNNHLFMPALRLTDYQDDFVEIVSTDHPEIAKLSYAPAFFDPEAVPRKKLINYFELRRLVSETPHTDFHVAYVRDDKSHSYTRHGGVGPDVELAQPHSYWAGKLLRFRELFAGDQSYCQH